MPHSDLSGTFTLVFLLTLLPSGGTLSNTLVDSSGDPLQIPTIMMYFLGDRQPTWYLTSLPFTEKQRVDEVSNMYGTVRRKASIPSGEHGGQLFQAELLCKPMQGKVRQCNERHNV